MNQTQSIDRRLEMVQEGNRETFLKLEEQAQSVLRQIAELQVNVAQIRVQQNALLPALRVADDILIAIFSHVVDPEDVSSYAKNLLLVTSVCSRWRAIATGLPSLWTVIHINKSALTPLFLARSRSALLSIHTTRNLRDSAQTPRPEQLRALEGGRLDRLRSLAIDTDSPELYKQWMDHLATIPAPALQHLDLKLHSSTFVVGSPILANETPSLRSLALHRIVYPPTSPLFSNLRHLSLYGVWCKGGYPLLSILEILSRTPALETLVLDFVNGLGDQHRGLPPETSRVALTRLRRFRLMALQPRALHILPYLGFSEDTTHDITVHTYGLYPEHAAIIDLPMMLQGVAFLRYAAKGGSAAISDTFLSAYREERPAEYSKPVLSLTVQNMHSIPQFSSIMDAFDLRSVVRFETHCASIVDDSDELYWHTFLKRMPALRTLIVLRNTYVEQWLAALTAPAQDDGDQAPACLCPELEHLDLRDVACDDGRFWAALGNLVTARWSMGSPLKSISLFIVSGAVDEEAMGAIRGRVETIAVHRP